MSHSLSRTSFGVLYVQDMKGALNEPVRAQLQLAADRVILEHKKLM